jgi:3-oxoacyl-[acyl-carrier-protein] synthase II
VAVLVGSSVARTCLGDSPQTFAALIDGACGAAGLRYFPAGKLNVRAGYQIPGGVDEAHLAATGWLTECVVEAVRLAGVDPARQRVIALLGTGLRELRAAERWALDGAPLRTEDLHFGGAIRRALPGLEVAVTLSNACGATGYALALGQDLLELGEADAVVVAGADGMTESMLAMIGRFDDDPADRVRPFDARRAGVLLGEGAGAVVLVPDDGKARAPVARLLGTGLSCDARHETAPDVDGIRRAMTDALKRAGRAPGEVDVVFAHGTGTALNDTAEATMLAEIFGTGQDAPLVTAVKGAVGHTSGASALTGLAMAVHTLATGMVPPVIGLREPLAEGAGVRFVRDRRQDAHVTLVQVDAFGFGGVNAVSLLAGLS